MKAKNNNSIHKRHIEIHDDFLNILLEKTKEICSKVNLFGGSISNASLYGIYIPMPTNFKLNVTVKDHEIESIEEERIYGDDTQKYSKNTNENIKKLGDQEASILRERLSTHIENGDEYNFPNPYDRPLIISAPWIDGYKKNYWTLNVFDIVSIYNQVILLGKPGTGKSTALKYLSSTLIENILNNKPDSSIDALSDKLFSEQYIPIYIEFRKLADWWRGETEGARIEFEERINLRLITRYLYDQVQMAYTDGVKLPCQYKYIFMFDGIDEIPQGAKSIDKAFSPSALNYLAGEIISTYNGDAKLIFSSRIDEFAHYSFNRFEVAEIVSMNEYLAIDLIDKIKKLCNDERTDSRKLFTELREKGFGDDIVFNPMLLSLLSFVAIDKGNGKLPDNKCEVLLEGIELLLKRWATKGEDKPAFFNSFEQTGKLYGKTIFKELENFAYMSEENGQINANVLLKFLLSKDQNDTIAIINYLSKTAGLIIQDSEASFKFAHKSFRSYLAASYICHHNNAVELLLKELDKSIIIGGINETLTLAVEILLDDDSQWYTLELFVLQSLEEYGAYDLCIWFIGKLVSSGDGKFYKERIIKNKYITTKLLDKLGSVFHESNQISINKRIECGYFLGLLGDKRDGIGNKDNIPNIVWCPVNECELEFGLAKSAYDMVVKTPWGADIDFSRELTKNGETIKMNIDEFEISKYPITVAQFTTFLQDSDGYKNKRWYTWSGASLDYYNNVVTNLSPKGNAVDYYYGFYLPVSFRILNLPITHVSFFVAVAFCKWLTMKLNDGTVVRLPTEMEWEAAAKTRGGNVYEWGDAGVNADWQDQYVTNNCNCLGTKLFRVCPVGSFHDSKDKIPVDLTGNVWEWTASYFTDTLGIASVNTAINTIDNDQLTTDNAKNLLITVRGGSLHNGLNCLRVSFRGRDPVLADVTDRHSVRVIRVKPRTIPYYDEKKLVKEKSKNGVAEGYGLPVKQGDKITIMYRISRDKELIQSQTDFTFVLGEGTVHGILEKELMNNHRRACNFIKHYLGSELFDSKGYKNIISPNDDLEVFIHIKDTMEIN